MKNTKVEYVNLDKDSKMKKLPDEIMDIPDIDDNDFEELGRKHDEMIKAQEEQGKQFEKLIEKQEQREEEMQKAYDDYMASEKEMEELEEKIFPRKQITVKLFPDTHKELKLWATSKDTTLEKIATYIVEGKIYNFDIVKYVSEEFKSAEELSSEWGFEDYEIAQYGEEKMQDNDKALYDQVNKKLKNGNPRRRINVKVYYGTHRKLRVMAAIQDRSLDNIVSSFIEEVLGDKIELDTQDLLNQLNGEESKK